MYIRLSKNSQLDKNEIRRFYYSSNDYDEFGAMLHVANIEERLLESGSFIGTVNTVFTSNVIISQFDINKKIEQLGVGTSGYITFVIWLPESIFNWRNHDMRDGMIGVLWKNEHQSVSDSGFKGLPVSIEENFFAKVCRNKGFPDLSYSLEKHEVLYGSKFLLKKIRNLVKLLTQQKDLPNQVVGYLAEYELVDLLIEYLIGTMPSLPVYDLTYTKFAKIADYIYENLSDLTSVQQICENTNIPERTVRRLIQNKLNLSPKKYLNNLRLNEVRKGLKKKSEYSNIIQIASDFNFWHMGQFTRDYKMLFGELPSETGSQNRGNY